MVHVPVLQKEVIKYLDPKPNENFIDCTIGNGGHTLTILEKNEPKGKILGIDADSELIENLKCSASLKISSPKENKLKIENFKKRVVLTSDNFANLKEIVKRTKFDSVEGILFDLGMSSWHLEESGRGFSFLKNEPLDMRYNFNNPLTAEKIVNYWSESEIERILEQYGEEKFAKKIAEEIVKERKIRPIKNTFQLVEIIKKIVPAWYQHKKIHFATRTFQALRIAVNDELNNLKKTLPQALEVLKPQGRLAVISFHSLEDRIVKNFFKEKAKENILQILTKKPIRPTEEEIKINRRSRSSKLRVAEKQ